MPVANDVKFLDVAAVMYEILVKFTANFEEIIEGFHLKVVENRQELEVRMSYYDSSKNWAVVKRDIISAGDFFTLVEMMGWKIEESWSMDV